MVFFAFSGAHERTTCSTSGRPPAGCNTFANADFNRVPLPAARITIATSLFGIVRLFSPAPLALTIAVLSLQDWTEPQISFTFSASRIVLVRIGRHFVYGSP